MDIPVTHILSVLLTTASLLTTRTPPKGSLGLPSAGGGAGGNISLALVTDMEDGISMGSISWMMGMKEAIVEGG